MSISATSGFSATISAHRRRTVLDDGDLVAAQPQQVGDQLAEVRRRHRTTTARSGRLCRTGRACARVERLRERLGSASGIRTSNVLPLSGAVARRA